MDLGDDATGYSECGGGSGSTCPQSGLAALEGGLKYITHLKAAKDLGVVFWRRGDLKLSLFADVDYADRCIDSRSVSGVAVMLGNKVVSASSTTHALRDIIYE